MRKNQPRLQESTIAAFVGTQFLPHPVLKNKHRRPGRFEKRLSLAKTAFFSALEDKRKTLIPIVTEEIASLLSVTIGFLVSASRELPLYAQGTSIVMENNHLRSVPGCVQGALQTLMSQTFDGSLVAGEVTFHHGQSMSIEGETFVVTLFSAHAWKKDATHA